MYQYASGDQRKIFESWSSLSIHGFGGAYSGSLVCSTSFLTDEAILLVQ